jgi:hypothetical protein
MRPYKVLSCPIPEAACDLLISNEASRLKFGLDAPNGPNNPIPDCVCHDICAKEVRLIGTAGDHCEFTQCFYFPPIGPCRLGPGITLPTIDTTKSLKVFLISAQEVLSDDCKIINVQIKLLILATSKTGDNILLPLDINVRFDTFFSFPDCTEPVTGDELKNALADIDGSSLVIQLKAEAVKISDTTQIIVNGKIIDKLWKHENLWLKGLRPYDLTDDQKLTGYVSFTVFDVFNHSHKIGDCGL